MTRSIAPSAVAGRLKAPASKSSMQRAVACALLADGASILRLPSYCADSLAALSLAEALGARVERGADAVRIEGAPGEVLAAGRGELELSCGESGLCIRMFAPIVALRSGRTSLIAAGSLAKRAVGMVAAPLEALGARCSTAGGLPPVLVEGPLRGGRAAVDASGSSQSLTGLLVALPLAPEDSLLDVGSLSSGGYIDLTLATMRAFGVEVEREGSASVSAASAGALFRITGRRRYRAADFAVEGDWSGAAFLLVAGAIAGSIEVEGLDARSTQPDRAILEALAAAGAEVRVADGPIAVGRCNLKHFDFDARGRPDLFPPLVALAANCAGTSRIRGAERLRGKESDRAAALAQEFGKLGVTVEVAGDIMSVRGGAALGGTIDSHGDHRIAMAAAVAALSARGEVAIGGAECVAKSWPSFYGDLNSIRA